MLTVLLVIIIACLSTVVAVFLAQCWLEERYGDLAARYLLPKEIFQVGLILGAGVLAVWLGMVAFGHFDRTMVMVVCFSLGLGALWLAWWMVKTARLRAGRILVDLGKVEPKGIYAVAAFAALSGLVFILAIGDADLFLALNGLFFASSALLSFEISKMRMLFTETGIYTPNGKILWKDVLRYHWSGGTEKSHTLLLTLRRGVFRTKVLSVPWPFLDQVNSVLEDYVEVVLPEEAAADPRVHLEMNEPGPTLDKSRIEP